MQDLKWESLCYIICEKIFICFLKIVILATGIIFLYWEKCEQLKLYYDYLSGRTLMEELEDALEDAKIYMIKKNSKFWEGKESGSNLLLWASPEVTKPYLCSSGKIVPSTGAHRLLMDHWMFSGLCYVLCILIIDFNSSFN